MRWVAMASLLVLACGGRVEPSPAPGELPAPPAAGPPTPGPPTAGPPASAAVGTCVDIQIGSKLLPGDGWLDASQVVRGGLWRTDAGLHVAWMAYRPDDDGNKSDAVLVVSTFDPETGAPTDQRIFDWGESVGIIGSADLAPNGTFAASYWVQPSGPYGLLVATLAGEEIARLELGDHRLAYHIGWDGEAFAVHFDLGQEMARISTTGELLLAPTLYGGLHVDWHAWTDETASDRETGDTFSMVYSLLSGHRRDGALPAWAPQGYVEYEHDTGSGTRASVAMRGQSAYVVYETLGTSYAMYIAELDQDRKVVGAPLELQPNADEKGGLSGRTAVVATGHRRARAFVPAYERIYAFEYDAGKLSDPHVLLQRAKPTPEDGWHLDFRRLHAATWNDEVWLELQDYTPPQQSVRVLRADPGCQYSWVEPD